MTTVFCQFAETVLEKQNSTTPKPKLSALLKQRGNSNTEQDFSKAAEAIYKMWGKKRDNTFLL